MSALIKAPKPHDAKSWSALDEVKEVGSKEEEVYG